MIVEDLVAHFKLMFQQDQDIPSAPTFFPVNNNISAEEMEQLQRVPTEEEIYTTLKHIGDLRAPGPDGYPAIFFKRCWHIVGNEEGRF